MNMPAPWCNFYGNMPKTIDYPEGSMVQQVFTTAKQYPNQIAYTFMGKNVSYKQLCTRIQRAAGAFAKLGIQAGDRVSVCLPNCPHGVDAFYGLNALGAIACMIHPLSAADEIANYLRLSQSKAILTLDILAEKMQTIVASLNFPCKILIATIGEQLPIYKSIVYPLITKRTSIKTNKEVLRWQKLLKGNHPFSFHDGNADACAAILYSGGTTGAPKGVCLSNKNFNALALQTIAASGCPTIAGYKMLSVMPLFHGFGLGIGIHTPLVGGACCILVPRFTVDSYAKLVRSQKPNFIPGVPTLFAALLQAKSLQKANLGFLKGVFSGGDSLSPDLKKRVDSFLLSHGSPVPIREGYGTTECVTASCLTPLHKAKEGSIGIPYPDMYYKIVKPGTDLTLPSDTEGEICIAGPTVMLGYWNSPDETALVLRKHTDGLTWLHTGDLGTMDKDGYVYFRQRIKRMIITNGYNVYPTQIEQILLEHPKIDACCVIGVSDPLRGQRVRAYYVANDDITTEELVTHCGKSIAKYALPKEWIPKKQLPKTAVGKIAYRILEEEAEYEVKTQSHS